MRKRLILLLIALLLIGSGAALYYAAVRFLPGFVREKLVKGLTEATGRPVTLDRVRLEFRKGFIIDNLRIYTEAGGEKTLLSIDEADAAVILVPWGRERKLLIPSLRLYGVRLDLVRGADGNLNIQDILERRKTTAGGVRPVVKFVQVADSEIVFVDQMRPAPSTTMLQLPSATAKASWNKIFLNADTEIVFNGIRVPAVLDGAYTYKDARWDVRLSARDVDPAPFLPYLPPLPFLWKQGMVRQVRLDATLRQNALLLRPRVVLAAAAGSGDAVSWQDADVVCEAVLDAPATDWARGRLDGRVTVATASFHFEKGGAAGDGRVTDLTGPFTWSANGFEMALAGRAQAPRIILADTIVSDTAAD
ncbi:MAG: hypothetical protein ACM3L6_05305, partial [Deltaproteobacteria bacterium]